MSGAKHTPGDHVFSHREGVRCFCGAYHYRCDACGADCTIGMPGAPCTQDTEGTRRCWTCQRDHEDKRAKLHAAADDLAAACQAALGWYNGESASLNSFEVAKLAAAALKKAGVLS